MTNRIIFFIRVNFDRYINNSSYSLIEIDCLNCYKYEYDYFDLLIVNCE